MRIVTTAAAQMGPIQRADTRSVVVNRMIALMDAAKAKGADFIVYPELALTTFFPRWYMEDQAEVDTWFEREMPSPETQPLFRRAREHGMAMSFGYAELTPGGEHFNTAIIVDKTGVRSSANTARFICPVIPNTTRTERISIWKNAISCRGISAFRSGAPWAVSSACASATTGAGRRPIASWAYRASR